MGSYRTKEDDVARISMSVYITNFPESVSAKELFHACKQYGHVVDSFIPTKRSKNGKRPPDKKEGDGVKKTNSFSSHKEYSKVNVNTGGGNSYMGALKWVKQVEVEDLKVIEFASLVNLKLALGNEDFKIEGRIAWVEVEGIPFKLWSGNTFSRIATKWGKLLDVNDQEETCFHSKRLCIYMKSGRSIVEEFKIIHRGKIYWIRANETPGWVPDFTDESDDDDLDEINSNDDDIDIHKSSGAGDNSDVEGVPETLFEDEGLVESHVEGESIDKNVDKSEDPFNIYPLFNKNKPMDGSVNKSGSSLRYPPGFTPSDGNDENSTPVEDGMIRKVEEVRTDNREEIYDDFSDCRANSYTKEVGTESLSSGHFKKSELPRTGGSILGLLNDVVKVGQMNFLSLNIQGLAQKAKKDWVKELCIKNKVNFLAVQETKMENMDSFCVRQCWGNLAFDHVRSDAVGNSGGILCVWDPNSFCKNNVTISDYFMIIRGCWRLTGHNFLLITVYAPQDSRDKQSLWDYLQQEIVDDTWKGSPCVGSNAMKILMGKLKFLKNRIREWSKTSTVCRKNVKAQYKRDLEAVDLIIDSGQGIEEEISTRADIINNIQRCDKLDSMEMAQKAKVKWAVEGDENSCFFHGMLNKKHSILNIRGVMVDGVWVDSPNKIHPDQKMELESEVTNEEIKKAVWECGTDKAPRPDGFTFGFIRYFWYLVKREVYNVVREKKQTLIFKVDFEKAYDSVRWDFLDDVLSKFGFGDKWRGAQQTQIDELAALMQPVTLSPISDRWTWTLNSSGEFSVASVRNLIDVKMFPEGDHKTRWIRYVPIKVNTHAWKVMTNSLPTRFNISRRGIDIDSITCANCDMGVETTSHLFFTCDMAQQVARLITRWWDVPDLEMDSYGSWKIWMVNLRMPSKNKKMLVEMSNLSKLEFGALNVTGKNYMPWVLDVKMHLESMGIAQTIVENNDSPPQDKARANIFLHLKDRFDNQREVLLPAVREEWRSLRFQDFKKVNEYSSALFRICSQLKFYGHSFTDANILEKTYSTFHASNMTLQQQYRLQKFIRYSELNVYLLVAEQNNELLMQNHQSRPTRSLTYPEVNATKNDPKSFMRGQGQSHGKGRVQFGKNSSHGHNHSFHRNRKNGRVYTHGRGFTRGSGQRTNKNAPRNNKAKNVGKRKHNGESGPSQNNDGSCFRCGSSNHWAKSCRTAPHLCELYQASLKEKDGEVNLVDRVDFENNDLDTSYFLSGDTELNTQEFFSDLEI
ncbi:RNA-directed DNA polymerase, eukaryota [Tanacetum coccineum]